MAYQRVVFKLMNLTNRKPGGVNEREYQHSSSFDVAYARCVALSSSTSDSCGNLGVRALLPLGDM